MWQVRLLQCSHDYQQLPLLNVHQLQHLSMLLQLQLRQQQPCCAKVVGSRQELQRSLVSLVPWEAMAKA